MATTSIWRVKGWLGKVVIYVENPDKTENPAFYERQDMTDRQAQGLFDVIDYAVNSEKTQTADEATEVMQQFVSGVNCHPATAREEMIAVKKRFGKEDGTVAYHGYQSFAPGEATPEMAHEIGVKLAQQLWGDKYQVIVATHLDKDSHLHNHFVANTVSFLDGLKYHRTEKDYYEMQKASDNLCREYGLSVIENPQRGKSRQYGEWRAEQEGRPTWRGLIRAEMDEVIRQSMTERQFFDNLRKRGYEVKVGKDISVRPPGKERFVRLERNFGEDYSHWYPIFAIMVGSGLRVGEITGLRWCDVDLKEGIIDVNHTLVYYAHRDEAHKHGCYYNVNTPKTKASTRQVPMLDFVKEAFIMEREYQEAMGIKCEVTIDGYTDFIFVNRFGEAQNLANLNKAIRRIIRDCNDEEFLKDENPAVLLPHFSCHSLRHTFTTRMCEAGLNVKVIQDALGHQDISTTLNIYADVTRELKKKEFAGLDMYFMQGQ